MSIRNQIIQKTYTDEEVRKSLEDCSGKSYKAITSFCVYSKKKISQKTLTTSIKYKHFSKDDIDDYVKSKQGIKKAGGICIEGLLESFVIKIIGNYSNIGGLPLYDVTNALISAGIKRNI
jgi:septum formation protein